MRLEEFEFGRMPDGAPVRLIRAVSSGGLEVSVTDYGATLVSVRLPDREGVNGEITLGFDTLEGYLGAHPYFGATVGRYANRIDHARFELDGKTYRLTPNDDGHHLHGGRIGFNRVLWSPKITADADSARIELSHVSPDGHEGYPGELSVTVAYTAGDDNTLVIDYTATTDKPTPVNLTNHTYWNLTAPGTDVRDHLLLLHADSYLWVDDELIPSGDIIDVEGTAFDFRTEKPIGRDFDAAGGYDHNFVIQGAPGTVRPAARVRSLETGMAMTVLTDQPAVQLYTSNMMKEIAGRGGVGFSKYGALCLETGGFDNAVNIASFPPSILRPGEEYRHRTIHRFSVE